MNKERKADGRLQRIGKRGEEIAAAQLKAKGYEILARNYSCRLGEIDIVARHGETTCFIEVKSRKNTAFGRPCEAVSYAKQQHMKRTAMYYLSAEGRRHGLDRDTDMRFDVFEVIEWGGPGGANTETEHIENAF
jgi:putative endonuclease